MGETNNNPFKFKLGAQTNVGCVRTNNEDNFVVSADLNAGEWLLPRDCHTVFTLGNKGAMLVVADGMGGLEAGEIASRIAVDTMKEFFSADKITDEIVKDASTIRKYMYEAVVAADEKKSGITIHYINEHYDEGNTIFQAKCPVLPGDTPADVAKKVHALEYEWFPKIIERVVNSL